MKLHYNDLIVSSYISLTTWNYCMGLKKCLHNDYKWLLQIDYSNLIQKIYVHNMVLSIHALLAQGRFIIMKILFSSRIKMILYDTLSFEPKLWFFIHGATVQCQQEDVAKSGTARWAEPRHPLQESTGEETDVPMSFISLTSFAVFVYILAPFLNLSSALSLFNSKRPTNMYGVGGSCHVVALSLAQHKANMAVNSRRHTGFTFSVENIKTSQGGIAHMLCNTHAINHVSLSCSLPSFFPFLLNTVHSHLL